MQKEQAIALIKDITDDEIAQEAKKRYPYQEWHTLNQTKKLASKRRRFIEGAKWAIYEILNDISKQE